MLFVVCSMLLFNVGYVLFGVCSVAFVVCGCRLSLSFVVYGCSLVVGRWLLSVVCYVKAVVCRLLYARCVNALCVVGCALLYDTYFVLTVVLCVAV